MVVRARDSGYGTLVFLVFCKKAMPWVSSSLVLPWESKTVAVFVAKIFLFSMRNYHLHFSLRRWNGCDN